MSVIISRAAGQLLQEFADVFRVVMVNGPRKAGKTVLLQQYQQSKGGEFRTLEDDDTLHAAISDPGDFVSSQAHPLCIDEVHFGGDPLIRWVKMVVDRNWDRGQFLLSTSTQFLGVPTLSESLAGRVGIIELWPLSMAEKMGATNYNFLDAVTDNPGFFESSDSEWACQEYLDVMIAGGFPEIMHLPPGQDRDNWYSNYLANIIRQDMRDFPGMDHPDVLPKLLKLITAGTNSPIIMSNLAAALGRLSQETLQRYLRYLEVVFLANYVWPWRNRLTSSRVVKTRVPKAYLTDSGLAAHLMGVTGKEPDHLDYPAVRDLAETFVFTELLKSVAMAEMSTPIYYYRDRGGRKVDFILETRDGRIIAIDVKATTTSTDDSVNHLKWLRDKLGDKFVAGIVLYFGQNASSHGDRIYALPISALWNHQKHSM